ncbi:MAG TPA: cupin domain-containing protein [Nocardioides sp.]|nr:cupin domain-containing protein [Nocardioides sp.]
MNQPSIAVQPYVLGPDQGDTYAFLGSLFTVKATGAQTGGAVSVAEFVNPPGFAPPLHRHLVEDEMFHVLTGSALFLCEGRELSASAGSFVLLPRGLAHSFVVGPDEPLHYVQITSPAGFEEFVAAAGEATTERRLPDPGPIDPAALGHAAATHRIEILGPPPV